MKPYFLRDRPITDTRMQYSGGVTDMLTTFPLDDVLITIITIGKHR